MNEATSDTRLVALIRDARLSPTPTRRAVLRLLLSVRDAVTHAEVTAALGASFDRVSVYRALVTLTRAGVLTRADAGDHVWRFAAAGGRPTRARARFVCSRCGAVTFLPRASVRLAVRGRVPRAVHARDVELHLLGECDDCATRAASAPAPGLAAPIAAPVPESSPPATSR